jgi:hypothetical protein
VANERLSAQERAVLALRDLERRPDDEIAAALEVDEADVPGLVGAARLHLLAELRPHGIADPCPGRLADLSAHADGMLPAERRTELETHVESCADCRATLFGLREAALRYRSLPLPEPPGELGSRITRALGLVGLPGRAAAADALASGGRQTVAAVAMGGLAILGVGVTIAASQRDRDSAKPARAPTPASPQPVAQPNAPASGSRLASGVITVVATRPLGPPPTLHHVRAGARRIAPARKSPPNPAVLQGLGRSFAPESPPAATPPPPPPAAAATPVTTPKPERKIPVEIVPPVAPSHAQAASDAAPPPQPPPAPEPPPPPQTTTP